MLTRANERNAALEDEVSEMREQLERERYKYKELWKMSCEQLTGYDEAMASKEEEVEKWKARLAELGGGSGRPKHTSETPRVHPP